MMWLVLYNVKRELKLFDKQTHTTAVLLYLYHQDRELQTNQVLRGADLPNGSGNRAIDTLIDIGLIRERKERKQYYTRWLSLRANGKEVAEKLLEIEKLL